MKKLILKKGINNNLHTVYTINRMTEEISEIPEEMDNEMLLIIYKNFIILREKMAASNRKYRCSENGKIQTKIQHKRWTDTKKDDVEYRNNINTRQRERYHIRKANKAEKLNQEALQNENKIENTENAEI